MIVSNTSPLLALDRIGRLHLLPELWGRVTRPQSVLDEIVAGKGRYGASPQLLGADWLETLPDPGEAGYRPELGAGETAAIALALDRQATLVLLDDLAARNVAAELGLSMSGTLGVLLAATRKGLLDDIEPALKDLMDAGFHMSEELLQIVRTQARDST